MVTAVTQSPGNALGQLWRIGNARFFKAKVASAVYTRGQVLVKDASLDPDGYKLVTAAANLVGPFVMVYENPGTAAVTEVSVVKGGGWICTADGNMEPGDDAVLSASTDGQVISGTFPTVATTPTGGEVTIQAKYFRTVVGRVAGFADSVGKSQVKAVDGDLVAIDADEGYGGA